VPLGGCDGAALWWTRMAEAWRYFWGREGVRGGKSRVFLGCRGGWRASSYKVSEGRKFTVNLFGFQGRSSQCGSRGDLGNREGGSSMPRKMSFIFLMLSIAAMSHAGIPVFLSCSIASTLSAGGSAGEPRTSKAHLRAAVAASG